MFFFFGIKLSKFQVKVKTVQVVTFVDEIAHLKLFTFVLFLHFPVLKIKKYCRTKDGCYAMLHLLPGKRQHARFFSVFSGRPGPKPGFSHFAGYLKKENSLRSLNTVFNNSLLKGFS